MSLESSQWTALRTEIKPLLQRVTRVENRVDNGMPDVNYCHFGKEGWIELKSVKAWPKKGGVLLVPHYRQSQRDWAIKQHEAGGKCYFLLKVGKDWLLFRGWQAARLIGYNDQSGLYAGSVGLWHGTPPGEEFIHTLRRLDQEP